MENEPLKDTLIKAFDGLSGQLQTAARFILDRPRDVALLSMREQARQAGVQPATMTRLAKHLGLEGFEDIRNMYAEALRGGGGSFADRAGAQVVSQKSKGDHALAAEMVGSIAKQIAQIGEPHALDRLVAAAASLDRARRVFCLGLRSSHAVVWQFQYILTLLGEKSTLLDGIAGTGSDPIGAGTSDDVLLVASVQPYTRSTVEIAEYAKARSIPIIAVTDSEVAPLSLIAETTVLVAIDSPCFFHTMTPAFAVAEILGSLIAGHGGKTALQAVKRFDEQLAALNTHLTPCTAKRQP